jgi:hypothetical protein
MYSMFNAASGGNLRQIVFNLKKNWHIITSE